MTFNQKKPNFIKNTLITNKCRRREEEKKERVDMKIGQAGYKQL